MASQEFSERRSIRAAWLAVPACALAIAIGGAHTLSDSDAATANERRVTVESGARPIDAAPLRRATNREVVPAAGDSTGADSLRSVTTANAAGVVPAVLGELPKFSTSDAEVSFLRTRLPGAKLEHENWTRSLASMTSAIDRSVSVSERTELERRRALLQAKLEHHAALLAQLESRIGELERSGEF